MKPQINHLSRVQGAHLIASICLFSLVNTGITAPISSGPIRYGKTVVVSAGARPQVRFRDPDSTRWRPQRDLAVTKRLSEKTYQTPEGLIFAPFAIVSTAAVESSARALGRIRIPERQLESRTAAATKIDAELSDFGLSRELRSAVATELANNWRRPVHTPHHNAPGSVMGMSSSLLRSHGFDTKVELEVLSVGFKRRSRFSKRHELRVSVSVRVVRLSDSTRIHSDAFTWTSGPDHRHTAKNWLANEQTNLRKALQKAVGELSLKVTQKLPAETREHSTSSKS